MINGMHTPAPWEVRPQGDANQYCALHNGDWLMFIQFNGGLSVLEQESNARLMSIAPELLEALQHIEVTLKKHPEADNGNSKVHFALHRARTAINKVGG